MRWSQHAAHTREKINVEFRLGNLMERYHLEIYYTMRSMLIASRQD
jgi:hypothetical protein